jgi:F-box-like
MAFPRVTIGSLPDEVLLEIFDFYLVPRWNWHALVHVCRRWRYVVFASPLRLELELLCTPMMPVKKQLDIWPALPLVIHFGEVDSQRCNTEDDYDNVIAALERPDRVRRLVIASLTSRLFERIAPVMQEPFPALTSLWLQSHNAALHVLPATFLNGSASSLQSLTLEGISFTLLPTLLLSANDLVYLELRRIPNTGYVSPEAMATCLSALTRLEYLDISFESPTPHPKRRNRRLPPSTRAVLPALTYLEFRGVSEYLEALAALIDAPLLGQVRISFFNQLVFDIPRIPRFIGHMQFSGSYGLFLNFSPSIHANIYCSRRRGEARVTRAFDWVILGKGLDWQVFSVAQICNQILPLCSNVESLNIKYHGRWDNDLPPGNRQDDSDVDPTQWLELFRSFTSVQSLEISEELGPLIATALQGLTGESATEVFPALRNLSIVGYTSDRAAPQGIESFITTRQHSDHPVSIHRPNLWTKW